MNHRGNSTSIGSPETVLESRGYNFSKLTMNRFAPQWHAQKGFFFQNCKVRFYLHLINESVLQKIFKLIRTKRSMDTLILNLIFSRILPTKVFYMRKPQPGWRISLKLRNRASNLSSCGNSFSYLTGGKKTHLWPVHQESFWNLSISPHLQHRLNRPSDSEVSGRRWTHGGGDGLCRARFLETQLKAIFSWVICGNRDGGGRVTAISVWQLRRQIEQLVVERQIHELESEIKKSQTTHKCHGVIKIQAWTFVQSYSSALPPASTHSPKPLLGWWIWREPLCNNNKRKRDHWLTSFKVFFPITQLTHCPRDLWKCPDLGAD